MNLILRIFEAVAMAITSKIYFIRTLDHFGSFNFLKKG